jgi:hypothetical protein
LKPNKVYVHHRYSNSLFKRIAHNTTNRVFQVEEGEEGVVYCSYQNQAYEFHFVWDFENYNDGINYINLFELQKEYNDDSFRGEPIEFNRDVSLWISIPTSLLNRVADKIQTFKSWYIEVIFGEKLIWNDLNLSYLSDKERLPYQNLQKTYNRLNNHRIITDNIPFKSTELPNNIFYSLTSTLFFWNNRTDILVYYEYGKNIHSNLNFDYLFNYNIKKHRKRRVKIGKLLNKKYTFVSQTDWNDKFELDKNKTDFDKIEGAFFNNLNSDVDFFNPYDSYFDSTKVSMDLYLRLLPKGKIQILDETFGDGTLWKVSQYIHLSEKTYGLILANIPFIPTKYYPLQCIYNSIPNVPKYPFDEEIKKYEVSAENFVEFVDTFYENQIEYLPLLEKWTKTVHKLLVKELENTNSFLDLTLKNVNNPQKTPLI